MLTPTATGRAWRLAIALLVLVVLAGLGTPTVASAQQESPNVVRVGWYESPYNTTDPSGRRSGYAYEYQRKVAAYTNWDYEYVKDSWPALMQKLRKGEIDLLSCVSFTEARASQMLFSSYPMGTEEYFLYIASGNTAYTRGDYSFFDGKRVGVNKDSVQKELFLRWEELSGVKAKIVELTGAEQEAVEMVQSGKLDAFLAIEAYKNIDNMTPVTSIGSSDIYFAVNKNRHDLLDELDDAMEKIEDENRFYSQELLAKYTGATGTSLFLDTDEQEWVSEHGPIRVGYQDNYLAYCAKDDQTGELVGALRDYLDAAANYTANAKIDFEAVPFSTSSAAIDALKAGNLDCVFPVNLSDYDAEQMDVDVTPPAMNAEVYAVVRSNNKQDLLEKDDVRVAVIEGDLNYNTFLVDHHPSWTTVAYPSIQKCLSAVADKKADCFLISNYRYNNITALCEQYHLTTLSTGKEIGYSFVIDEGETELYSIFARIGGIVPQSTVNSALTRYFAGEENPDLITFIRHNPSITAAYVAVIVAMVLVIIAQQRRIRAERKVDETQHQVEDLSQRVFVDPLTHVRNKGAFEEHVRGMQARLDEEGPFEFAFCMLDCDNLKLVNDQYGHELGDEYLKTACHFICRVFQHSPVFRVGGDEFAVVLEGEDFEHRDELAERFQQEMREACEATDNLWEQIHLSMGIATFDPQADRTVDETLRHADHAMYEDKWARKGSSAR